jgi:hypothetical protein
LKTKLIATICGVSLLITGCSIGEAVSEEIQTVPLPTVTTTIATKATTAQITETAQIADADETAETEKAAETTAKPAETKAKTTTAPPETTTAAATTADAEALYIKELFDNKKTDVWVSGKGTVTRILADDNSGDRHQRFILELSTGQTLLVAHNIDIAPYLEGLAKGDTVSFYGEYYYSDEGGGVHWTHHDPDGSSDGGWLKWGGKTYK